MKKKLDEICSLEKINCESDALDAIVKISKGDMRSAINSLQHVGLTIKGKIITDHVYKVSGHCIPKNKYQYI